MMLRLEIKAILIGFIASVLTSCSLFATNNCYRGNYDYLTECWMGKINTNPKIWLRGADKWFLTGFPNQIELMNNKAPPCYGTTITNVSAPFFDNILVDGSFQVQIIGNQPSNSISILGPHSRTRYITIDYAGNGVRLKQVRLEKVNRQPLLSNVIVRIGVGQLHHITHIGRGNIYGRCINTKHLSISSFANGNLMFYGKMNLTRINHMGRGTITLMGAYTPSVSVYVAGGGSLYLLGRVGVQSIYHVGHGCVNIIGGDSDGLCIETGGCGLTTVSGIVNLRRLIARGYSQVYLNCIKSTEACVAEYGCAKVGLSGYAQTLRATLFNGSHFLGSYLQAGSAFVHTRQHSHANVDAKTRLFAAADHTSTIYFYGSPQIAAKNPTDQAMIVFLSQVAPTCPQTSPNTYLRRVFEAEKDW